VGFVSRWLMTTPRESDGSALAVEDLAPIAGVSDDELADALGRELRRNYVEPDELAALLEKLGAAVVAQHLRDHKLPSETNQRHGDFGEVLAAAIFRHSRRYCVPILKLRYKQRRNLPLPGADVLAFRFSGPRPVVAVTEVKTRSNRQHDVLVEAVESLGKIIPGSLPEAISFVHARFRRTNPVLADRITGLLAPTSDHLVERFLVVVHEKSTWRDDVIETAKPLIKDATTTLVVHLAGLATLVKNAYERASRA
jgi:Cap4 SAVED domain